MRKNDACLFLIYPVDKLLLQLFLPATFFILTRLSGNLIVSQTFKVFTSDQLSVTIGLNFD